MNTPGQFLLYTAPDGTVKVDVFFRDETVWLTPKALAELFGVGVPAINKHLKNIFESGELRENSVISILETTAADGKTYSTRYYNLDAIIAVGYRVNSYQATQFRIWATKTLREFILKGFVLDDARLKQGKQVEDRIPLGFPLPNTFRGRKPVPGNHGSLHFFHAAASALRGLGDLLFTSTFRVFRVFRGLPLLGCSSAAPGLA